MPSVPEGEAEQEESKREDVAGERATLRDKASSEFLDLANSVRVAIKDTREKIESCKKLPQHEVHFKDTMPIVERRASILEAYLGSFLSCDSSVLADAAAIEAQSVVDEHKWNVIKDDKLNKEAMPANFVAKVTCFMATMVSISKMGEEAESMEALTAAARPVHLQKDLVQNLTSALQKNVARLVAAKATRERNAEVAERKSRAIKA